MISLEEFPSGDVGMEINQCNHSERPSTDRERQYAQAMADRMKDIIPEIAVGFGAKKAIVVDRRKTP